VSSPTQRAGRWYPPQRVAVGGIEDDGDLLRPEKRQPALELLHPHESQARRHHHQQRPLAAVARCQRDGLPGRGNRHLRVAMVPRPCHFQPTRFAHTPVPSCLRPSHPRVACALRGGAQSAPLPPGPKRHMRMLGLAALHTWVTESDAGHSAAHLEGQQRAPQRWRYERHARLHLLRRRRRRRRLWANRSVCGPVSVDRLCHTPRRRRATDERSVDDWYQTLLPPETGWLGSWWNPSPSRSALLASLSASRGQRPHSGRCYPNQTQPLPYRNDPSPLVRKRERTVGLATPPARTAAMVARGIHPAAGRPTTPCSVPSNGHGCDDFRNAASTAM
jgi:hypothetical protein